MNCKIFLFPVYKQSIYLFTYFTLKILNKKHGAANIYVSVFPQLGKHWTDPTIILQLLGLLKVYRHDINPVILYWPELRIFCVKARICVSNKTWVRSEGTLLWPYIYIVKILNSEICIFLKCSYMFDLKMNGYQNMV